MTRRRGLNLKTLIWGLALAMGLSVMYAGLPMIGDLFDRAQRAGALESALHLVTPRQARVGVLRWLPDAPGGPREIEPFTRDAIASDYLLGFEELAFAHLTKDSSGLGSYFQQGALADALLAVSSPARAHVVSWDHRLTLRFFAPDGATVAFTDTAWSARALEVNRNLEDVRFEQRTMDVVMQLDDGNWRVHHWRVLEERDLEAAPRVDPGLRLRLAQVRGANYVGRSHPFGEFWRNFNRDEVKADFALMGRLGLNTVRIFVPHPVPEDVVRHLGAFLDEAQNAGVGVIVTLLDGYTRYKLEDLPEAFQGVSRLLPELRRPVVVALDVKNEAERDAPKVGWSSIRAFLSFMANWLRHETRKPITAGLSDPDASLADALDFVTVHHYAPAKILGARLEAAKIKHKPVLLEEFGAHTQLDKLPDPHTEGDQARYYADVLAVSARAGVGFLAWTLHDFPSGAMPGSREVERRLGLVREDGSLKPAARVLLGEAAPSQGWLEPFSKFVALKSILPWLLFLAFGAFAWRLLSSRRGRVKLRLPADRS